eukprot:3697242-Prymnesium_polylepis.3
MPTVHASPFFVRQSHATLAFRLPRGQHRLPHATFAFRLPRGCPGVGRPAGRWLIRLRRHCASAPVANNEPRACLILVWHHVLLTILAPVFGEWFIVGRPFRVPFASVDNLFYVEVELGPRDRVAASGRSAKRLFEMRTIVLALAKCHAREN